VRRSTENIERLFVEDIIEKKKAGRGAFHMRGKGVKHGSNKALRTPYHFMKTKEKNKLNGEVEVHNMYTTILNWTEFNLKDRETQKTLLTKWREIYTNDKIMAEMSIERPTKLNSQSYADIVNDLGCPKKRRNITSGYKKQTKEKAVAISAVRQLQAPEWLDLEAENEQPKVTYIDDVLPKINGLHLEYNGDYDSEQLNKIFTKLQLLIDGEDNKFKISISITENV
jgi:hypothetical protein